MLKPSLEDFEHYLTSMGDECNCLVVWTFLVLPFFGIGMRTDLFQPLLGFPNLLAYWVQHLFTASSFRILNSSARIPSSPLTLLAAALPKAHLILYSTVFGSEWEITPSSLAGSLNSFLVQFCVFFPSLLDLFCFYRVIFISEQGYCSLKPEEISLSLTLLPCNKLLFFSLLYPWNAGPRL